MRRGGHVLVVLALLGPGCAGPDAGPAFAASWPTMDVSTTATEPFELRGPIRVAWADGLFAIESATEPDLARRTLVAGEDIYTSNTARWIRDDLDRGLALGNRPVMWDLRAITESADMRVTNPSPGSWTFTGTVSRGTYSYPVTLDVVVEGGRVASARLTSSEARESPITFSAIDATLGFPLAVPTAVLDRAVVSEKDEHVVDAHAFLLQLVRDYRNNHAGTLPERIHPDDLRLELLARGGSWPQNPYGDAPMSAGTGAGQFTWERCTLQDGVFEGMRWDGVSTRQPYGAGCGA